MCVMEKLFNTSYCFYWVFFLTRIFKTCIPSLFPHVFCSQSMEEAKRAFTFFCPTFNINLKKIKIVTNLDIISHIYVISWWFFFLLWIFDFNALHFKSKKKLLARLAHSITCLHVYPLFPSISLNWEKKSLNIILMK